MSAKVQVQDLEHESKEILFKYFAGNPDGHSYYGKHKYVLPTPYKEHVDGLRNMPLRMDDVWVASFPRSGTTWTQELTWLINNDLDYDRVAASLITERYVFIEVGSFFSKDTFNKMTAFKSIGEELIVDYRTLVDAPSPRFFKTHLPMSLLSPQLLDTSRVVYIARDPRDVAVSFYHHNKLFKRIGFVGDFKDYWTIFRKNLVDWAPFFEHVKEAWAQRNHPNMLFLFYEELSKDLPANVRRVASFFGKKYNDEQIQQLCEHLSIDKMKNNKSVHPEWMRRSPAVSEDAESFIRKGKVGGWRQYFNEEMSTDAEAWIQDNLRNTDLRFPDV